MSTTARAWSTTAIAFIVAGAAIILALVIFAAQIAFQTQFLYLVSFAAMVLALVLLARRDLTNGTARTAVLFAALGWLILVVATIVPALPGIVASAAYFVIGASGIAAGIVVVYAAQLTPQARIAFASLMGVTALYMASAFFGVFGPFAALLTLLLGIGALVTAYLLQTRR